MRVAPKPVDDGLVPALKVQVVFHARLRKQRDGLFMNHGRFAVHVRHVGKHALRGGQEAVLPAGHQLLRQGKGQRVLRKGAGGVAVDVVRELVQYDDLRAAPRPSCATQTTHTAPPPRACRQTACGWFRLARSF